MRSGVPEPQPAPPCPFLLLGQRSPSSVPPPTQGRHSLPVPRGRGRRDLPRRLEESLAQRPGKPARGCIWTGFPHRFPIWPGTEVRQKHTAASSPSTPLPKITSSRHSLGEGGPLPLTSACFTWPEPTPREQAPSPLPRSHPGPCRERREL